MSVLCRLFGHKLPTGYGRDHPYLHVVAGPIDGIGRHHVRLEGDCRRCSERTTFAYAHIPEPANPRWFDRASAQ